MICTSYMILCLKNHSNLSLRHDLYGHGPPKKDTSKCTLTRLSLLPLGENYKRGQESKKKRTHTRNFRCLVRGHRLNIHGSTMRENTEVYGNDKLTASFLGAGEDQTTSEPPSFSAFFLGAGTTGTCRVRSSQVKSSRRQITMVT